MPPRVRRQARLLKDLDPTRFYVGGRLLGVVERGLPEVDGIHVDLVRPDDLLQLGCTFVECDLATGGTDGPAIVPRKGKEALLVVDFAFQHAHEEAIYEQTPPGKKAQAASDPAVDPSAPQPAPDPQQAVLASTATTGPGVGFRPARGSRLVFQLGVAPVPFSTAGVLAAMKRPLKLADRAAASALAPSNKADKPYRITPGLIGDSPVLHLGDGLVAELRDGGPVVLNAPAGFLRSNPAPDTRTLAGALEVRRNLGKLRAASATATPVVLAGTVVPVGSLLRPGRGWTIPEIVLPPIRLPRRPDLSKRPAPDETAIEAPFRLVISPSSDGRFTHATDPVRAEDEAGHVELWHTRLAGLPVQDDGEPDEKDTTHRIVRALWARDRDWAGDDWKDPDDVDASFPLRHPDSIGAAEPFLGSLDGLDRHMLVRQTSETWISNREPVAPAPVGADALWLSALGAWLDLHGEWDTLPYSAGGMQSILSWDHLAPMGRDQYVRVVYPGYLYPFGHRCALVKVTERKMKTRSPSYAGLYQRMFLVVGQRTRTYSELRLPFTRVDVRPLVTPSIDFPAGGGWNPSTKKITPGISTVLWPKVGGEDFVWNLDTSDQDGQAGKLHLPLMWVNEAFNDTALKKPVKDPAVDAFYLGDLRRRTDGLGQNIAFVPKVTDKPDSRLETRTLYFRGAARLGGSDPTLTAAEVVLPAVQRLSPTESLSISYRDEYVSGGLGGDGKVWAEVNQGSGSPSGADDPTSKPAELGFGGGGAGSDKSGGFLAPNLPIRALSVDTGPVGHIQSAIDGTLDPAQFLQGAFPKLFGLIDLVDLLEENGVLPAVVTDTVGQAMRFVKDVQHLRDLVEDAVKEADQLKKRALQKSADLQQQANDAVVKVTAAKDRVADLVTAAEALVPGGSFEGTDAQIDTRAAAVVTAANAALPAVLDAADLLSPLIRDALRRYVATVKTLVAAAGDLVEVLKQARDLLEAQELTFHFDWRPKLQNWPESSSIFTLDGPGTTDHLVLSVDGRVSAAGKSEVNVAAELRDFSLTLFGEKSLMKVPFDHLSFKAGSGGKSEIDVVLGEIEFLGLLSFVETIKDLIPLDGFSDPPYMEVTTEGAKAGFTLALPTVAIGVFNLSNMSLGADVSIPFLGKSVTVGFNFCSRERPFTLTVMCLGGGGWFLIRVAPDGLDVLEVGLEATACLSIDLGVASGSISAAIGIYIRLEGEKGSLTGYFRLRGEVDVLGLISASIELYMELVYKFDTGKMIGRATITVEVDVLIFSGSVEITAERQFAGSNGDPSFREVLGADSGSSPLWNEYAAAFAAEEA